MARLCRQLKDLVMIQSVWRSVVHNLGRLGCQQVATVVAVRTSKNKEKN